MNSIKIGFRGAGIVGDLGSASDMELFFDCILHYVVPKYLDQDWTVLTDRFYRRYLRLEDLDIAVSQMELVKFIFKELDNNIINTDEIKLGKIKSDLDLTRNSLYDIFNDYFELFFECLEFANYDKNQHNENNRYQPVMVAITSLPYSMDYDLPTF